MPHHHIANKALLMLVVVLPLVALLPFIVFYGSQWHFATSTRARYVNEPMDILIDKYVPCASALADEMTQVFASDIVHNASARNLEFKSTLNTALIQLQSSSSQQQPLTDAVAKLVVLLSQLESNGLVAVSGQAANATSAAFNDITQRTTDQCAQFTSAISDATNHDQLTLLVAALGIPRFQFKEHTTKAPLTLSAKQAMFDRYAHVSRQLWNVTSSHVLQRIGGAAVGLLSAAQRSDGNSFVVPTLERQALMWDAALSLFEQYNQMWTRELRFWTCSDWYATSSLLQSPSKGASNADVTETLGGALLRLDELKEGTAGTALSNSPSVTAIEEVYRVAADVLPFCSIAASSATSSSSSATAVVCRSLFSRSWHGLLPVALFNTKSASSSSATRPLFLQYSADVAETLNSVLTSFKDSAADAFDEMQRRSALALFLTLTVVVILIVVFGHIFALKLSEQASALEVIEANMLAAMSFLPLPMLQSFGWLPKPPVPDSARPHSGWSEKTFAGLISKSMRNQELKHARSHGQLRLLAEREEGASKKEQEEEVQKKGIPDVIGVPALVLSVLKACQETPSTHTVILLHLRIRNFAGLASVRFATSADLFEWHYKFIHTKTLLIEGCGGYVESFYGDDLFAVFVESPLSVELVERELRDEQQQQHHGRHQKAQLHDEEGKTTTSFDAVYCAILMQGHSDKASTISHHKNKDEHYHLSIGLHRALATIGATTHKFNPLVHATREQSQEPSLGEAAGTKKHKKRHERQHETRSDSNNNTDDGDDAGMDALRHNPTTVKPLLSCIEGLVAEQLTSVAVDNEMRIVVSAQVLEGMTKYERSHLEFMRVGVAPENVTLCDQQTRVEMYDVYQADQVRSKVLKRRASNASNSARGGDTGSSTGHAALADDDEEDEDEEEEEEEQQPSAPEKVM